MRPKKPSHATVVAYIALIVALGGSAFAVTQVGSRQIANDSIRSKDLRDEHAVRGRDVRDESLTGAAIREKTLDASGFSALAHGAGGGCDPADQAPIVCAQARIDLPRSARVLVIGSGGFFSVGGPAMSTCEVDIDGQFAADISPGETTDTTDLGATDGFTTTGLSRVLPAGAHLATLECGQLAGDARMSQTFVAAIALGDEP